MSRSVLLVEDDPRVRRVLKLALTDEGYRVREAATGEEGLRMAASGHPDVVLLDVLLPDTDGYAVCRALRRGSDVPVIMVTARADSHDVVAGLEAGADDYVTKPVVAKELSARIRALLRRTEAPTRSDQTTIAVGDLTIGLDTRMVTRNGQPVDLTRTEFRLLAELARTEGPCTREHLLESVWGYGYFGDTRIVDVHVRRLRLKIERDPSLPQHVVTVRGVGYRLDR